MATRYYQTPYGLMTENQVMQIRLQQAMEQRMGGQQQAQAQAQQQAGGGGAGRAVGGLAGMGGTLLGYKLATDAGGLASGIGSMFGGGGAAAGAAGAGQASGAATLATGAGEAASGLGAATGSGTGALSSLGLAGASPILAGAGLAAGAATGAMQGKGVYDAIKGKDLDMASQAALALPTFGLSFAYNPIRRTFGSSKGKDQMMRDAVRKGLRSSGFLDENNTVGLADGSRFDMGKDGGDPRYNVDFNRAGAGDAVGFNQILGHLISGGNKKVKDDVTGYLSNAAMQSGDVRENSKGFLSKYGFDHGKAYGAIASDTTLDQNTRDSMLNGLDQLYGVGAYANKNFKPKASPGASQELLSKSGQVGYNPDRMKQLVSGMAQQLAPQGSKNIPLQLKGKPVGALQALGSVSGVYPTAMTAFRR